jgi:hypothetical protein
VYSILFRGFLFFLFISVVHAENAKQDDNASTQAENVSKVASQAENLAKDVYESYDKLTNEDAEKAILIGYMVGSFSVLDDSQAPQIESALKNFLKNPIAEQIPALYVSALQFVANWISAPDIVARNAAKRVFLTMLVVCQDLYKKNHVAEIQANAAALLNGLNSVTTVSPAQLIWLTTIESVLGQQYHGETELDQNTIEWIVNTISRNFLAAPNNQVIHQEIFCSLFFVANMLRAREPSVKTSAYQVLTKTWAVIKNITKNVSKE